MKFKTLSTLLLPLCAVAVHSQADVSAEIFAPAMQIADENCVAIPGVTGSTRQDKLLSKGLELGDGNYCILRPNALMEVRGTGKEYGGVDPNEPTEPVPTPTPTPKPTPMPTPPPTAEGFPLVVTKTAGSETVRVDVPNAMGPPVLTMSMRGLEHQNVLKGLYINGTKVAHDSRWNSGPSSVVTASLVLPVGLVNPGVNTLRFEHGDSSRDKDKQFTVESLTLDFDQSVPVPPDPNTVLGVVSPDNWNPRDVKQITNPNSLEHPEFTALLARDDLHWADSLRPYTDNTTLHDFYYGQRRNAGADKPLSNPRMSYDANKQASRLDFVVGELGQKGTYQTRIKWPAIGPDQADMVTVQWQMLMYKDGIRGGKQFQITNNAGLHLELNAYYRTGLPDVAGAWATVPVVRVYSALYIGEKGLSDRLVSNRPAGCAGVNRCASQPALPFGAPKKDDGSGGQETAYTLDDHVSLGGTAYLTGDEDLSGWITITVTFDWRDPLNHKVWMFLSDERTPPTLVIGTDTDGDGWGDDGYRLGYGAKSAIDEWWAEFNNSSTVNATPSHVWLRNVAVVKGPIVPLEGTGP